MNEIMDCIMKTYDTRAESDPTGEKPIAIIPIVICGITGQKCDSCMEVK